MHKFFYAILLTFLLSACATTTNKTNLQAANYNMELGLSYLQQGDVARAKYKLLLAQQQAPQNAMVQDALGYFFERTGETNQAEKYYLQAVTNAPNSGSVQNNYGTFLCRQGQYQAAIKHFLLATQDPNYLQPAKAYENAGLCALKIPDKSAAKDFFNKALAHDPSQSRILRKLTMLAI